MAARHRVNACELINKLRAVVLCVAVLAFFQVPARAQQPEHPVPNKEGAAQAPVAAETAQDGHDVAQGQHPSDDEHGAEEEHASMWGALVWPTVNFAILAGGLWWFFKEPIATYLRDRHSAIRRDLVEAANVKAAAAAQLAELERKLQALPGEIDTLRKRGADEIAAEETRIATLAAAERERLLEQTRREIDVQLRLAKRELVEHTADLAVQLAGDRIRQQITPEDQDRLTDRYIDNVKGRL